MKEQVDYATMDDRECYLFDLQGYLVVRGILSQEEVNALNEALDANTDKRGDFGNPNAISGNWEGRPLEGIFSPFRHYKGMLTWEQPWCQPFRDMLAHPNAIPYLNTMLGRGWKLDHGVDLLNSVDGCEGLKLHGSGNLTFSGSRFYAYQNGRMRCGLIVFQYALTDVNPGDGGLCVIPGSHKSNFEAPEDIMTWEANKELVFQPTLKAGDLVIFNEATSHGTLPWKGKGERRTLLFRYTPKYLTYVPGTYETQLPEWVSELSEAQQAALEPPYIYHHPMIEDDGVSVVRPRREGE